MIAEHADKLGLIEQLPGKSYNSRFSSKRKIDDGKPLQREFKFVNEYSSGPEAAFFARAYLEVLLDYSDKIMNFKLDDQLALYRMAAQWPREKFVKFAGYCKNWPMAKFLKNDTPEVPEGFACNPLGSGAIKRFLKTRICARSSRNARLWNGVLQGVKRACMKVSKDFIHDSMVKHRKHMTYAPENPVDTESVDIFDLLFEEFKPKPPKLHEASASASFEAARSEGGARAWLQNNSAIASDNNLISMPFTKRQSRGKPEPIFGPVVEPSFAELVRLAAKEPTNVQVSAVIEPLKVRLITKGNSLRYWVSRDFQKQLWQHLQEFPQFALTGEPLEERHLHGLLERERDVNELIVYNGRKEIKFDFWVSGDYSSATDTLNLNVTKAAFEAALRKLSPESIPCDEYFEVLRSVLYEQTVHYKDLDPAEQLNGQLMGSTLSFPILCMVNLMCYIRAFRRFTGVVVDPRTLPVIVNGDDILFRANTEFYEVWKEEVARVGFTLSLGKNYVSSEYLTANSQLFKYAKPKLTNEYLMKTSYVPLGTFQELGYLNAGLLTGVAKVTGRGPRSTPVWDYFNFVMEGAINPERARMRFIHYHKDSIKVLTQNGKWNLYISPLLGGCGFKLPETERKQSRRSPVTATPFQRSWASFMKQQLYDNPHYHERIALIQPRKKTTPQTWKGIEKLLIEPLVGPYQEGVISKEDLSVVLPPLAARLEDDFGEESPMKFRHPKKETMEKFRSRSWRRMRRGIFKSEMRIMVCRRRRGRRGRC
jgi:hypothetical protein